MSELLVFIVGTIIFAITVCGSIISVGITLTRREIAANPHLVDRVDKDEIDKTFFKY